MPDCWRVSSSSAFPLDCQAWQAASAYRTGLHACLGSQLCSATANEPERMLRALQAMAACCTHRGPPSEDTPLTAWLAGCNTE